MYGWIRIVGNFQIKDFNVTFPSRLPELLIFCLMLIMQAYCKQWRWLEMGGWKRVGSLNLVVVGLLHIFVLSGCLLHVLDSWTSTSSPFHVNYLCGAHSLLRSP